MADYAGLQWDLDGERLYETGVDHMALSVFNGTKYPAAVAWNGITAITESPSGAESNKIFADNIEYLNLLSKEEYGATIEAYMYPPEFEPCNGAKEIVKGVFVGQQNRQKFAYAYRTKIGSDSKGDDYGYKLHFVWGAKASPSEKQYNTINDSPEAMTLSWEISTVPTEYSYTSGSGQSAVTEQGFVAHLEIDSTTVQTPANLAALEAVVFGTESAAPGDFPMPSDVLRIIATGA